MFRSRSWFGGNWNKPKNRLSLEHLKYLYGLLEKNTSVSESNRGLLVESLRSIAEILIWGDQHDSSVFDFFLEKNMLSYFLHIMRQKSGGSSYVCVQLLQTLNILFENIRNETSLYYLLSNNHVNSIIVHKFDFSDEDVMGYYILFLKTLSLKLNTHTIHFFYNEHTNDFPLYTEAIKFFNHPESMVRIAVRTISLNVYRVQNINMLKFIRDKTAAPYFSNLVWFIGKHILELDACVRMDIDHQSNQKLSNLVAEHLDHLHYLNDILLLDIKDLNAVLTEHLLHKLFIPLYIFSLIPSTATNRTLAEIQESINPRVSPEVALYLLSLVFLVVTHGPLVHALTWVILNGNHNVFKEGASSILNSFVENRATVAAPSFEEPNESLEQALNTVTTTSNTNEEFYECHEEEETTTQLQIESNHHHHHHRSSREEENHEEDAATTMSSRDDHLMILTDSTKRSNITDEEKHKLQIQQYLLGSLDGGTANPPFSSQRPFLEAVLNALNASESDYPALLALCLIYAMNFNTGIKNDHFHLVLAKYGNGGLSYKNELIERLLNIVTHSIQPACRIRLVTIEIALQLLLAFLKQNTPSSQDPPSMNNNGSSSSVVSSGGVQSNALSVALEDQRDVLYVARNHSMAILRNFYKSEDIFLDLFEDEYNEMLKSHLNVEYLCMDSSILLPPTATPLTGIPFTRRLPCGEVEKASKAIRIFFLLRRICQQFLSEKETLLPLTRNSELVQIDHVLDLNNSDLIACTIYFKDNSRLKRFLVIDSLQLILVEPDAKLLGWGIAKFVGFLQDIEVLGDKDDSRCLHITVHSGGGATHHHHRAPLLSARFLFDDHIRCMAAKQRLTKGRSKARQKKMFQIAQMIEMPGPPPMVMPQSYSLASLRSVNENSGGSRATPRDYRPILSSTSRIPGFAAALRRDNALCGGGGGFSRAEIMKHYSSDSLRNESVGGGGGGRSRRRNNNSNRTPPSAPAPVPPPTIISSSSNPESSGTTENSLTSRITKSLVASRENSEVRSIKDVKGDHLNESEEIPLEDFQHSRNNSPHGMMSIMVDQLSLGGNRMMMAVGSGGCGGIGGGSYNEKTSDRLSIKANDGAIMNPSSGSSGCLTESMENKASSSKETSFIGRLEQQETSSNVGQIETV